MTNPNENNPFLDDGSDWFNLACTRIAVVMLVGIAAIAFVAEIV